MISRRGSGNRDRCEALGPTRRGTFVSLGASALVAGALVSVAAAESLPVQGVFARGKECKGDGSDRKSLLLTINANRIESSFGPCDILAHEKDGPRIIVQALCKTRKGDDLRTTVGLTLLDDGKIEIEDRERDYRGVLFKCPASMQP